MLFTFLTWNVAGRRASILEALGKHGAIRISSPSKKVRDPEHAR